MEAAAEHRVSYLCDVEGDWDYLCRFVAISEALSLDEHGVLALAEGWRFVFGGDLVDKAPGDLRCGKALVELKKLHPDRVVLLLGNRDINKMRFTSELHDDELAAVRDLPGPFWVESAKRVAPLDFVKQAAAEAEGLASADQVDDAMLERHNTKPNRLRWILKDTMGAVGHFERRREELQLLGAGEVSDDDVVRSFEASVGVGAVAEGDDWMRQYLELGQLAFLHRTTLFVHGGVVMCSGDRASGVTESNCIGHVPGRARLGVSDRASLQGWVDELNAWAESQVESWKAAPHWCAAFSPGRPQSRWAGAVTDARRWHGCRRAPGSDRSLLERSDRGGDALMRCASFDPGTQFQGLTCTWQVCRPGNGYDLRTGAAHAGGRLALAGQRRRRAAASRRRCQPRRRRPHPRWQLPVSHPHAVVIVNRSRQPAGG